MSFKIPTFAAIALAGGLLGTAPAQAHDFTILRGVDANMGSGRAPIGRGDFRWNPVLSTFNTVANAEAIGSTKPCYLNIRITGLPNAVPVQGDAGTITIATHVYNATFDNVPVGHWSIDLGGQLETVAKDDFRDYGRQTGIFTGATPPLAPALACRL